MEKNRPAPIANILLFSLAVLTAGGCASYYPVPLAADQLPPDFAALRVEAKMLRHPLLPPLPFDERDGVSPDEAAILAVLVNPELQAARSHRGVAAAQLVQAGILPNPQLSYGMEFPTGGNTGGSVTGHAWGLSWDIRELLARSARVDAARAQAAAVDLDLAWQEWQVAEGAKLQVYKLLYLAQKLPLLRQLEADAEATLRSTQRGVELGERTVQEAAAAAAALAQARLAELEVEQAQEKERLTLNRLLGLPPGHKLTLQPSARPPESMAAAADSAAEPNERRLDLLALSLGYASQEAQLRAAVRSRFPRINVGLSRTRETDNLRTVGFAVALDLPIFDSNQGAIAEAAATREQLFAEYQARLFAARAEMADLQAEIASTLDRLRQAEAARTIRARRVEIYRRAVELGEADLMTYEGARYELATARLELIELRQKLNELSVAREIATGQYLPADVGEPPATEDPGGDR